MKMVAAVVRPMTVRLVCRIVPAPMKPMPVTTPAATRSASPGTLSLSPSSSELVVSKAAATHTIMWVRSPAGLFAYSRSTPIARPNPAAARIRRHSSASVIARLPPTHSHGGRSRRNPGEGSPSEITTEMRQSLHQPQRAPDPDRPVRRKPECDVPPNPAARRCAATSDEGT